nr:ribose-phosphate diphosphokinase [Cohnella sp. CFH 77786]
MHGKVKIFSGSSNRPLAEKICSLLGQPLGEVKLSRFKSGEVYVSYQEPIRTCDVFIIQSLSHPINDHFMELIVMIDAAKRASAKTVNIIVPYYGYARQERKRAPREAISAKLIADTLTMAGASRIITVDLHADAIQGFFNIPVDHLTALDEMTAYLRSRNIPNPVVVSPDPGRAGMAEKLANDLGAQFAIMIANSGDRTDAGGLHIVGDVEGMTPIVIKDIIDTGKTVRPAVDLLKEKGADRCYVLASHGLFSHHAIELLDHPHIQEVAVTDSIAHEDSDKFTVISMAKLIADAIRINTMGGSIATLFKSGGV